MSKGQNALKQKERKETGTERKGVNGLEEEEGTRDRVDE